MNETIGFLELRYRNSGLPLNHKEKLTFIKPDNFLYISLFEMQ